MPKKFNYRTVMGSDVATTFEVVPEEVVEVKFILEAPNAKAVSVAGTFNNWSVDSLKAKKDKKGNWIAKVNLKPGRYEYLFFVDGQWRIDPLATETVQNGYGSVNSVVNVMAES